MMKFFGELYIKDLMMASDNATVYRAVYMWLPSVSIIKMDERGHSADDADLSSLGSGITDGTFGFGMPDPC